MSAKIRTLRDFLRVNPVISEIPVKWGDMDAFAHVNNTVYFKYQEEARLKFFKTIMSNIDASKFDVEGFISGKSIGPILSETYCKFKFPMKYPDKVLVGSTITPGDVRGDRYKLSHTIWSLREQIVVSEGYGTIVNFNYKSNKSEPLQPILLEAIQLVSKQDSLHLEEQYKSMKFT